MEEGTPVTDPCLETNWAFSNETMWSCLQNSAQAKDLSKDELEGKKKKSNNHIVQVAYAISTFPEVSFPYHVFYHFLISFLIVSLRGN